MPREGLPCPLLMQRVLPRSGPVQAGHGSSPRVCPSPHPGVSNMLCLHPPELSPLCPAALGSTLLPAEPRPAGCGWLGLPGTAALLRTMTRLASLGMLLGTRRRLVGTGAAILLAWVWWACAPGAGLALAGSWGASPLKALA